MSDRTTWALARLAGCADPDGHESAGADFLRLVEESAEEAWDQVPADERADAELSDITHEIADGCVPVYTYKVWQTFTDLGAWQEDPTEVGCDGSDMEQAAKVCLYMIGERLAWALLEELQGEGEE